MAALTKIEKKNVIAILLMLLAFPLIMGIVFAAEARSEENET